MNPIESDVELEPPITGFFRGWWCFFTWEYTPPRGQADRADYYALLKRMGLSEAAVWINKVISPIADILLTLALTIRYDDWFTEHDIRFGRHTGNLSGLLWSVGIFIASQAVVSYFQTLAWFLLRDEVQNTG